MKKINIALLILFITSLVILLSLAYIGTWIFFSKEVTYSRNEFCYRQEICKTCNKEFNCIIKNCESKAIEIYDNKMTLLSLEKFKKYFCLQYTEYKSKDKFITSFCQNVFSREECNSTKISVFFSLESIKTGLQFILALFMGFK